MGETTAQELKGASITKIAGQNETVALDISENCGKKRLHAETVERASSSLLQTNISVGTNATDLKVGGSNLTNRRNLTLRNNGTNTIFIGSGTNVTTSNGFPVKSGETLTLPVSEDLTIKAITSTGTVDTRILEVS
jgi:hypothetical protein